MFEYLIALVGLYFGWSLVCLEINHRRASSMGIPLVRVPVDPLNILFQVFEPHLWKILDLFPSVMMPNFARYMRRGWFFLDKADSHLRYGPIFACVTPRGIHVQVCDSEAIHDMFSRRFDFVRPSENYKLLEVYGPCISTASPTEWPRHRKILAAPFNESVMKFVWSESLEQTKQMNALWVSSKNSTNGIQSVAKDTRTLSLNVLAATGFRRSFSFRSSSDGETDTDAASSYREALSTVLDNAILLMLIPPRYLLLPIFPKSLQRIGRAAAEFKNHMERMLEEETTALKQGKKGAGSLMTSFVKAMNTYEAQHEGPKLSQGLSAEEIFGNIFVINFAGHDTTANTLAFSMVLLATEPEVQEWVAEEVRKVIMENDDWEYGRLFPQLVRCRAILFETLRLFPPILSLPKRTSSKPQRLQIGDRSILIPANTSTSPSLIAVHTHPQYWPDPLKWNPSRWIITDSNAASSGSHHESLITPLRDTYFPWSDGPQNCPGLKFSQVEFVAVLASLMCHHLLTIVREDGETKKQARERAVKVINDCDMQLLLRMRDADRVRLRCERRS
ncbi:cytochrome P450 monooxygenase [Lindgomyces ingoldianus]|uniref:Cytochrome P450 monooxygenase n=1 Tax=Lindgomyces ingoldianus TaxID=673940 RepID=A0ACB6QVS1_9PLEO|nr:cytochrome P450 monooxygenase [Lindgomyces ingoldianus]KAF2470382.1 cytochrome P450 monooxygenase [Lindgomyces ingoldianus]